jgi:pimeloyl-ACP methyl ester carboxylesterase
VQLSTRSGDVHIETLGSGPRPLLAITPIGAAWLAAALPRPLHDVFTIHIAELPGTGRSTASGACTVDAVSAAVVDLVQPLGQDTVLFGHSMNGALALAAAVIAPCAGVLAVTPAHQLPPDGSVNTAFWDATAEDERKRRAHAIRDAFEGADDTAKADLYRRYNNLRQWRDMDFDSSALDGLEDSSVDGTWVNEILASGSEVDWARTFDSVAVPVFLALGAFDFLAPPTAWADEPNRRGWTINMFSNSAHNPFVEEPEEFVDSVTRWLAAL